MRPQWAVGKNEDRGDKPNGTRLTAKFPAMLRKIESALKAAPEHLQKQAQSDITLMKPKSEGGRFDNKSRCIYMEPLQRLLTKLEKPGIVEGLAHQTIIFGNQSMIFATCLCHELYFSSWKCCLGTSYVYCRFRN